MSMSTVDEGNAQGVGVAGQFGDRAVVSGGEDSDIADMTRAVGEHHGDIGQAFVEVNALAAHEGKAGECPFALR